MASSKSIILSHRIGEHFVFPGTCGSLSEFDPLWDELFPAEQARIVRLLVERVQVIDDGIDINLRVTGLVSLLTDLRGTREREAA